MLPKAKIKIGQRAVRDMGFKPGPIDGIWGPQTAKAWDAARDAMEVGTIVPTSWLPDVKMSRIICHWTAGHHDPSRSDLEHYHILILPDGSLMRGKPSIALNATPIKAGYAEHTRNCNSGSIGVTVCGMVDAKENPFDPGPEPFNEIQWRMLAQVNADLCRAYDIEVTPETVLTHAEVQGTLHIHQAGKWDITRLPFDIDVVGAAVVGGLMRAMTREAL